MNPSHGQRRDLETLESQTIRKIQRANLWRHVQPNRSARRNRGDKVDANSELAKLYRHCAETSSTSLQRGIRKFAAGEEAGLSSVDRQHVGLGEHLDERTLLKGSDRGRQIQVGTKQEDVQNVRKREGARDG